MNNFKICFLAQFPPPIHGLSKAVETLYNSRLNTGYSFEKVDISNNKKFISTIISLIKSDADLFYFTISQSKGGNLRDLILMEIIRWKGKKYLIHLHGGYYRELIEKEVGNIQKKANYRLVSNAIGAIVLCERFKDIFKEILPEDRIYVVSNCVDNQFINDSESFHNHPIKQVLYLSNFIQEKGYRELLEIANIAKIQNKPYHFNFAGKFFDKKEKLWFENYVKDHNLREYVEYHGIVSGESKKSLLAKSDIFVLLTRYAKEGQPISILEAMANGLAIVATSHAGIPDMIEDGKNGIIVKSEHDYADILNQMDKIDFDNVRKINMSTVSQKYREENYIAAMDYIFEKCTTATKSINN